MNAKNKTQSAFVRLKKQMTYQSMVWIGLGFTLVFAYLPMFGIVAAFEKYTFRKGFFGSEWVGLDNFARFFHDPDLARIIGNTISMGLLNLLICFPLPILFASFIFSINGTIKVFDSVFALTGGGPGNSTTPLTLYMYRTAFQYSDFGYGSTIALLLTVMCLLVTLAIFRSSRRDNTV